MRSPAGILLSPVGLAPATASVEAFHAAVRAAAGPDGFVEIFTHDGDSREPSSLSALSATPGRPADRGTLLFLHGKGGCGAEWTVDSVRALGLGFNVLVAELPGHAPSPRARITSGGLAAADRHGAPGGGAGGVPAAGPGGRRVSGGGLFRGPPRGRSPAGGALAAGAVR